MLCHEGRLYFLKLPADRFALPVGARKSGIQGSQFSGDVLKQRLTHDSQKYSHHDPSRTDRKMKLRTHCRLRVHKYQSG